MGGMPWVYSTNLRLSARPVVRLLERSLGSVSCCDRLTATITLPAILNLSRNKQQQKHLITTKSEFVGHWKHIIIVPSPLFQLGNLAAHSNLQNFPHASRFEHPTPHPASRCTGTGPLGAPPQSAVQLPNVDHRLNVVTFLQSSGQVSPGIVTWTPELPAHELLLCAAPRSTEQAADRHSTFRRSWRRGCFSRQASLRLTSLTDRPAAQRALASGPIPHPYRTLSAPWVSLVPCFRAGNCPGIASTSRP